MFHAVHVKHRRKYLGNSRLVVKWSIESHGNLLTTFLFLNKLKKKLMRKVERRSSWLGWDHPPKESSANAPHTPPACTDRDLSFPEVLFCIVSTLNTSDWNLPTSPPTSCAMPSRCCATSNCSAIQKRHPLPICSRRQSYTAMVILSYLCNARWVVVGQAAE